MAMPSLVRPANAFLKGLSLLEGLTHKTECTVPCLLSRTETPRFKYYNAESFFCSGSPSTVTTFSIVMPLRTGPMEEPGSTTIEALDDKCGFFEHPPIRKRPDITNVTARILVSSAFMFIGPCRLLNGTRVVKSEFLAGNTLDFRIRA